MTAPEKDFADFGFRRVGTEDKPKLVRGVFDRVAGRYDLMNDLMSAGVHRLWKQALIDWLAPRAGMLVIDVAGGTGDIARRIVDRTGGAADVIVCDVNSSMLREGRSRKVEKDGRIAWTCGDAEQLPFPDKFFDAYTIAFGIRNVTRIEQALREAWRVLRPGGRFLCLEFSHVAVPGIEELYDAYSFQVIPWLGAAVAGEADAYRYLVESIRRFPRQKDFAGLIADAGLGRVQYRNLSGGIAALHSAWRI